MQVDLNGVGKNTGGELFEAWQEAGAGLLEFRPPTGLMLEFIENQSEVGEIR